MKHAGRLTRLAVVGSATALLLSVTVSRGEDEQQRKAEAEKLEQRRIHIYGKVLDEDGSPVNNAEAKVQWDLFTARPNPLHEQWVKTDSEGEWDFETKAWRMFVREVRAPGYLFSRLLQDPTDRTTDVERNRTSPTNRIVLRLHKMRDPTFIVANQGRLVRTTSGKPFACRFDMFQRKTWSVKEATNETWSAFYPDLEVQVERYGTNGGWRVVYRTPNEGCGLLITNILLFMVPDEGLAQECVLEGTKDQDFPRYLYLRTRTPAIYSRFQLRHGIDPDTCIISYEAESNPYGGRSLEPYAEMEPLWQLRERLAAEAIREITAGRRPAKPDYPKLIRGATH